MPLQIRRGLNAERTQIAPANGLVEGELLYTTDEKKLYIGTGSVGEHQGVVITGYTDSDAKDAAALILTTGDHVGVGFSYDSQTKQLNATVDLSAFDGPIVADSLKGSVFADDSSILLDAIDKVLYADVVGNLQGNVTGNVVLTGTLSNGFINIEENTVGSSNSILNFDNIHNIEFDDDRVDSIDNSRVDIAFNADDLTKTLRINRFSPFGEFHNKILGTTQGILAAGNVYETSRGTIEIPTALTPGDAITVNAVLGHDGSEYVASSIIRQSVDINATVSEGSVPGRIELLTIADGSFGSVKGLVVDSRGFVSINRGNNIATAELDVAGSVKASVSLIPGVYADSVARDTAIPAPTAGMIVFVTDVTKFQGYNGTAWTDLN